MSSEMQQLYQQLILDHAREQRGRGEIDPYDAESYQFNPVCGDEVTLRVRLDHPAGGGRPVLAEVGWQGDGCSISPASASVLTDLVTGKDLAEVDALHETFHELMQARGQGLDPAEEEALGDAAAFTGVARYPARIKCALLGWVALRDAVARAVTGEGARPTTDTARDTVAPTQEDA